MRFQKTNFSDYLKAPDPVSPEPGLTVAPADPYDLHDAESVAAQLESLLAATQAQGSETAVAASPPPPSLSSPPSSPLPALPSAADPAYDLLPVSRGRKRRTRS